MNNMEEINEKEKSDIMEEQNMEEQRAEEETEKEIDEKAENNPSNENASSVKAEIKDKQTEERHIIKNKWVRGIVKLAAYVCILIVCAYAIPTYVAQRTVVDGDSMEANYHDRENLIANKFIYNFTEPKRFDVIVFYPYGKSKDDNFISFVKNLGKKKEQKDDYYIKRVIGLPGETIQIKGPDIYINNKKIKENYGKMKITDSGCAEKPLKLKKDEFFVMGDNREISLDSRSIGPVKKKNIAGKIIFKLN